MRSKGRQQTSSTRDIDHVRRENGSSSGGMDQGQSDPYDGFTGVLKRVEDSVHYLCSSCLRVQFAEGAVSIPHTSEGKRAGRSASEFNGSPDQVRVTNHG
jgi:hypothetical protein